MARTESGGAQDQTKSDKTICDKVDYFLFLELVNK